MTNRWIPRAIAFTRRYLLLILVVAGLGVCFGLLGALISPDQYRSTGKLRLLPAMRQAIVPGSAFSGDNGSGDNGSGDNGSGENTSAARSLDRDAIQNELQVLAAPQLFAKVVETVGADQVLAPYDPASRADGSGSWLESKFHALQSWWFQSADKSGSADLGLDSKGLDSNGLASMVLARSINMYPEVGTNVISVAYVSHSPELAQKVVDATLEAAIAIHREVFTMSSSLGAIEEEMQVAEQAARIAEGALRTFSRENSISDYEVQHRSLLADLSAINRQISNIEGNGVVRQKAELTEARTSLASELAAFDAKLPDLRRLELDARQKRGSAGRLAEGVSSMRTVQRLEQVNIQVLHKGTHEPIKIGPALGKRVVATGLLGALAGTLLALLLAWRARRAHRRRDLAILGAPL